MFLSWYSYVSLQCFHPLADVNQSVWSDSMDVLFLRWTSNTNLTSLAGTVSLRNLQMLTLAAVGDLSTSLLEQISACSRVLRFPSLTRLVIFAGMAYPALVSTVDFRDVLRPFLSSVNMREIYIQLPSFEMAFCDDDFDYMLEVWSLLTLLHVSFVTPPTSSLTQPYPDLRHIIEDTHVRCPHLSTLHLPAIAAYSHHNIPFVLQPPSLHSHFRFSSDILVLEHPPYEVAFHLASTFPRYMPIRTHFIVGTFWSVVVPLVKMVQLDTTLEDVEVSDWRMELEE